MSLPSTETFPDTELAPRGQWFDPATLGFPPMLPIELVLGEDPPRKICEAYGIDKVRFTALLDNPVFQRAITNAQEMLAKDGMSFRVKARMQSEALLEESFRLIKAVHTPANVKADLIKATWKVGGLEPKEADRAPIMPLQINIHL